MTRMYELTPQDAAQVKAILQTHAEMQDHRTLESLGIIARLKIEEKDDPEAMEFIDILAGEVEGHEKDCENLKRIANIF